ncbi:MAG: long-chain fatty acid--CoA ligase [Actinobacteria bacterium]|nr:long-chain fatty acid--CoA ligase [Actinomycetota bacterium]MCB9413778.1 long-chain fatty acid--CoA ligase [Actinomycetota bacterium]
MILDRVNATPNAEAFRGPLPDDSGWRSLTWKQTYDDAEKLAAGLLSLGLEPEQRVAIASNTRLDWVLADMAIMIAGGATTTVYPSTGDADVAYILGDSNTRFLFAEDDSQVEKVRAHKDELNVEKVVIFDGSGDGDWVISMDDLRALGETFLGANPEGVKERAQSVKGDNLATLIYTSGTTGKPKGVELTHSNWTYEGAFVESINIISINDVHFLWLPLAHSFGKVLLALQLQVGFVTAVDGRVPNIVDNLGVVKPTIMAAVPRIFEKVYARVAQTALSEGGAKAKIFTWAFKVGNEASEKELAGEKVGGMLAMKKGVADKLVFSKIRERLGGNMRYMISGSAALSRDIATWFYTAGLPILEGYGLTETSAATCVMRPDRIKFGTVGEPAAGTEIKIAGDGEILIRGPGVMRGYRNLPEANAEVFPGDGWFATGDIGEIDDMGRVKITDRKKDLVKTSGGKYIAPSAIESQFKAISGLVGNMVVHANDRNFASALITLDPDAAAAWAAEHGKAGASLADIAKDPEMLKEMQGSVDELNARLNKWETIKKFEILDRDFTVEEGELTPSLKVKRKAVEEKYRDILDAMYS